MYRCCQIGHLQFKFPLSNIFKRIFFRQQYQQSSQLLLFVFSVQLVRYLPCQILVLISQINYLLPVFLTDLWGQFEPAMEHWGVLLFYVQCRHKEFQ